MDPQPEPGVLIPCAHAGRVGPALLVALAAACGGDPPPAAPSSLPALAGPTTLMRLPRDGGQAVAYGPDDLRPAGWSSSGRLPPLRQPLGADLDERLVFAVDESGNLATIDLETRTVRGSVLGGVAAATLAGDGSIYVVAADGQLTHLVRRMPTRLQARLPGPPAHLFGVINDRMVAVTGGDESAVIVVGHDTEAEPHPMPAGPAATTLWGDLLAVATDTGVVLYDSQRRLPRPGIRLGDGATAVAFSPSGHRIYVGRGRPDLLVFDRFTLEELGRIPLDAPATAVRPDASGRWVLVRLEGQDSVHVIDATLDRVVARVAGEWASDLPLVAGAATLVVRQGGAVEAWDLSQAPPARTGRLEEGGADFWTLLAWVPPARAAELAEAADSNPVVQDSAITFGVLPVPVLEPARQVYLQVSSSQNADWARELARQLSSGGYPALVRDPDTPDQGYRVLLGPYPSREAAEEAGRRLGRPYFVLTDPQAGARP